MHPLLHKLIIKVIALAFVLIPIIWAWWRIRRSRDKSGRLPAVIDQKNPFQPVAGSIRFEKEFDGIKYQCETHPGNEEIPTYLVVTILRSFNGDFSVTKVPNGERSGWLKRHAITHVLSGDEYFDAGFNVITDRTPAFATECFRMPETREAVQELFAKGFLLIRNDGRGIDAIWSDVPDDVDLEDAVKWTSSRLHALAECCIEAAETQKRSIIPERFRWPWILALPIMLPLISSIGFILLPPQSRGQHVDELYSFLPLQLLITVAFLAPWLLLSSRVVKGRGCSRNALIGLGLVSTCAFFAASFPPILLVNSAFDHHPSVVRRQPVIDFRLTDSDFRFDIISWRNDVIVQEIFVSKDEFTKDRLRFSRCELLDIETKPGLLGFEWIRSVTPVPNDRRFRDRPLVDPSKL